VPRDSSPTIQEFRVRAVRVPMSEPHQTASGVITESPLVLTDVITDGGISGHSMVFTYTCALRAAWCSWTTRSAQGWIGTRTQCVVLQPDT
jgi:Mandelate racemase / muconate lactonizing enzyme, N-terminal domain